MTHFFQTSGYENLELSTQVLIKAALQKEISIEILDIPRNFISLSKNGNTQWVQQATRTAADPYISAIAMNNKAVTKMILQKENIRVPLGKNFSDTNEALHSYPEFENIKCIVKPNSTNFGTAIFTIEPRNFSAFQSAVHEAFTHDDTIIIEEFAEGKEYRFLVIGDEVAGVLHRVPANIIGDGVHSIEELIDIKNDTPMRGKGHVTPLEIIEKLETEQEVLSEQNLSFSDIVEAGKTVYLRNTSNISTGGDSITLDEEMHEGYKRIALQAMKTMKAKISGLDMIIKNIEEAPNKTNYSILELNFNPSIYMHTFPFSGKKQQPAEKILTLLGF